MKNATKTKKMKMKTLLIQYCYQFSKIKLAFFEKIRILKWMKKNERKNQAQKAYLEIRRLLVARLFEPGQRLPEKNWAEKLNVNRADVKQAMSRLLGEGLLMLGEKGGFFVKDFTQEELVELMDLRIILETAAAELAIKNATEEEIGEMEKIANLMLEMADNNYRMGFNEADLHFHEILVGSAHNKKLQNVYTRANLPISGIPAPHNSPETTNLINDAETHKKIVTALRTKDKQQLAQLITHHLLEGKEAIA